VKNEYPIRGVLERFGFDLKEKPGKVRCVFHDDGVASGLWSEYHYTCFACGARGDAPRLLHDYEGLEWGASYAKAEELAKATPREPKRLPGGPFLGKGSGRTGRVRGVGR
jgi:hypothetical protein